MFVKFRFSTPTQQQQQHASSAAMCRTWSGRIRLKPDTLLMTPCPNITRFKTLASVSCLRNVTTLYGCCDSYETVKLHVVLQAKYACSLIKIRV